MRDLQTEITDNVQNINMKPTPGTQLLGKVYIFICPSVLLTHIEEITVILMFRTTTPRGKSNLEKVKCYNLLLY